MYQYVPTLVLLPPGHIHTPLPPHPTPTTTLEALYVHTLHWKLHGTILLVKKFDGFKLEGMN